VHCEPLDLFLGAFLSAPDFRLWLAAVGENAAIENSRMQSKAMEATISFFLVDNFCKLLHPQ
jgi:hypothetical protein